MKRIIFLLFEVIVWQAKSLPFQKRCKIPQNTTIAPWMQFYQQAAVVDKGITAKDYGYTRIDVLVGCIFAIIVVFFILVTCASTIHANGLRVETVGDAAQALRPLAGKYCAGLFAFGLLNASLFAASISTATLVGHSGATYQHGLVIFNYNLISVLVLVFFAWIFLPA